MNSTWIWRPMRSVTALPMALYDTAVIGTPAHSLNSSADICDAEL